jgi:hypothetical protein
LVALIAAEREAGALALLAPERFEQRGGGIGHALRRGSRRSVRVCGHFGISLHDAHYYT